MDKFTTLTGIAAPLPLRNIDTDMIIPKQFLKTIHRTGLGKSLFFELRYDQDGNENPDFVLNKPAYRKAQILVTGENFGCGSSREHAVWALAEYGIRAIVAPSFSPIFYGNCIRNGLLPVRLPAATIAALATEIAADPSARALTLDLGTCELRAPSGEVRRFEIEPEAREMLLEGLDAIDLTLKHRPAIEAFWHADRVARPWIYLDPPDGGH
jgi:3-isopropylmalate/(R)-2-methylmalate dehydratase small subunit